MQRLLQRCRQFESENILLRSFASITLRERGHDQDFIRTQIGIIGDKVGSGKSYVVLALMLEDQNETVAPVGRRERVRL
jgi:hypothetical protein